MKLIIGCGYLGRRVARRWRQAGQEVCGLVRRESQGAEIAREGIRPIVADVTRPETLCDLPSAETVVYSVGFDPAGGKSRWDVYVEGLRAVLDSLSSAPRRLIFISSTGVYGEAGGQWVDEDTPCRPTRDSGEALLAAEQVLGSHPLGQCGVILRLAGIYGPGRLPRTAELREGHVLAVPVGQYVNLIHVEDAASAVLAAESHAQPPRIYVVSDGRPVDRREYLTRLAEVLNLPVPRFREPSLGEAMGGRGSGDKRVGNARMLAELGVKLACPSYFEGLAAAVENGDV